MEVRDWHVEGMWEMCACHVEVLWMTREGPVIGMWRAWGRCVGGVCLALGKIPNLGVILRGLKSDWREGLVAAGLL